MLTEAFGQPFQLKTNLNKSIIRFKIDVSQCVADNNETRWKIKYTLFVGSERETLVK